MNEGVNDPLTDYSRKKNYRKRPVKIEFLTDGN